MMVFLRSCIFAFNFQYLSINTVKQFLIKVFSNYFRIAIKWHQKKYKICPCQELILIKLKVQVVTQLLV